VIADIARHRPEIGKTNTYQGGAETRRTAKVGESKSLPLIDADTTDQGKESVHREIWTLENPNPTAEGGDATREIGDRERKRKPPAGGQAVFDLNIVHSRRRGCYAPRAF
jgi:hypothetical protein